MCGPRGRWPTGWTRTNFDNFRDFSWRLRFASEQLRSGAMKLFSVLLVTVATATISCERQKFEGPDGTKQLNQAHGAGAAHEEESHPEGKTGH